jgi:hypothetical protein
MEMPVVRARPYRCIGADFQQWRRLGLGAGVAGRRPDRADLRDFKRNPANLRHSIMPIEPSTRGYGTYSKCSQYGL